MVPARVEVGLEERSCLLCFATVYCVGWMRAGVLRNRGVRGRPGCSMSLYLPSLFTDCSLSVVAACFCSRLGFFYILIFQHSFHAIQQNK